MNSWSASFATRTDHFTQENLSLLETYYTSGEWRDDYEADERGELPPDLKRGVLSQDALYDLLDNMSIRDKAFDYSSHIKE